MPPKTKTTAKSAPKAPKTAKVAKAKTAAVLKEKVAGKKAAVVAAGDEEAENLHVNVVAPTTSTASKGAKVATKKKTAMVVDAVLAEDNIDATAPSMMAKILDDAQRSVASHTRSFASLCKLYRQDTKDFFNQFVPHLNKILVIFKKEAAVDRLVSFISAFATRSDLLNEQERDAFVEQLLTYLLSRANAKDKAVRFRVCQLVAMVVDKMADDAEISDELFDRISEMMMTRSTDQAPVVRATSVEALHRLQEDDKDDPVVAEMSRRLASDSSKVT